MSQKFELADLPFGLWNTHSIVMISKRCTIKIENVADFSQPNPFDASEMFEHLRAIRREMHAHPEVGLTLPWTQRRVLDEIEPLDLEISRGESVSWIAAVLRGAKPGPTVLLRADMDALPGQEATGLEFASTNGAMHACGHDLHTTALIGAATLLAQRRHELSGTVVFVFQSGEEGNNDGARIMIDEGAMDVAGAVDAAYAIHVLPGPLGLFITRPGTLLAGASVLDVTVHGQGGHGSQPELACDPVPALLEIGTALQSLATRSFGFREPVVITTTMLHAGDFHTMIPDTATLGATVRTLSTDSAQRLETEVRRLVTGIAEAHGCTGEAAFSGHYPATVNDPAETAATSATLAARFGAARVATAPGPLMGSEDFSHFLEKAPGAMFGLCCTPPQIDQSNVFNHSPLIQFDDSVLGDQATALAELAWARLNRS